MANTKMSKSTSSNYNWNILKSLMALFLLGCFVAFCKNCFSGAGAGVVAAPAGAGAGAASPNIVTCNVPQDIMIIDNENAASIHSRDKRGRLEMGNLFRWTLMGFDTNDGWHTNEKLNFKDADREDKKWNDKFEIVKQPIDTGNPDLPVYRIVFRNGLLLQKILNSFPIDNVIQMNFRDKQGKWLRTNAMVIPDDEKDFYSNDTRILSSGLSDERIASWELYKIPFALVANLLPANGNKMRGMYAINGTTQIDCYNVICNYDSNGKMTKFSVARPPGTEAQLTNCIAFRTSIAKGEFLEQQRRNLNQSFRKLGDKENWTCSSGEDTIRLSSSFLEDAKFKSKVEQEADTFVREIQEKARDCLRGGYIDCEKTAVQEEYESWLRYNGL